MKWSTPAITVDDVVDMAKALGNQGRLRVLAMLRGGSLCVCQITSVLGFSGSTVSAHLAELRHAGLVAEEKRGKWVHYRLSEDPALRRLLDQVMGLLDDDTQLRQDARVVSALRDIPADDLCRAGLDLRAVRVKRVLAGTSKGSSRRHAD